MATGEHVLGVSQIRTEFRGFPGYDIISKCFLFQIAFHWLYLQCLLLFYLCYICDSSDKCERDVVHRMNEGYRAWGALKSVLSNRGLRIKAKKCLYEGVIVPTALYGAEAWGMRSAERRKGNVLEMKCLRSLVGVSRMDRVRNEEVRRRARIERELASRADQRVLR